jgi:uncharacterized membrane protein YkoI
MDAVRAAVLIGSISVSAVVWPAGQLGVGLGVVAVARAQQQPAQSSLAQAVRAAEKQTGGRARSAELRRREGTEVYRVKTVSTNGSATVFIDVVSGAVVGTDRPGLFASIGGIFEREDQQKDQAAFAQLGAASLPLVGAVELAEKQSGGRAIQASMRRQYGSTLYEVRVVTDLIVRQRVLIDGATGNVVTPPQMRNRDR